jgi:hypothetical protein
MITALDSSDIVLNSLYVYTADAGESLLVSAVNNHIRNIAKLNDLVGYGAIELPTPQDGTYYTISSNVISEATGSGSKAYAIDLTSYIGNTVKVKFTTTAGTSTRVTALCDADGRVLKKCYERDFINAEDGVDFTPTSTYYMLYISFGSYASNLTVSNLYGMYGDIEEIKNNLPPAVAYVDGSASVTGDGTEGSPFLTIQEAVDSGAEVVKVKAVGSGGTTISYGQVNITDRMTPLRIMLWNMGTFATDGTNEVDCPKIYITGAEASPYHGFNVQRAAYVELSDIWVDGVPRNCFRFENVGTVICTRCYASNNSTAQFHGFALVNANGVFRDCKAWSVMTDGYNMHGFGDTQIINCMGYNCGDDGISHHDACTGAIIGGEYYGNTKGGVSSPTYGSKIDVQDVYSHDNAFGLYAVSQADKAMSKARVSGCIFKSNTNKDIKIDYADVTAWHILYDTKLVTNGTLTELD